MKTSFQHGGIEGGVANSPLTVTTNEVLEEEKEEEEEEEDEDEEDEEDEEEGRG